MVLAKGVFHPEDVDTGFIEGFEGLESHSLDFLVFMRVLNFVWEFEFLFILEKKFRRFFSRASPCKLALYVSLDLFRDFYTFRVHCQLTNLMGVHLNE